MQSDEQRQSRRVELDHLLSTFGTDGWHLFSQDVVGLHQSLTASAAADCDTNDKWQIRRGQLQMLETILGYAPAAINESDSFDEVEAEDDLTNPLED